MRVRGLDGRWITAAILLSYFAVLALASYRAGSHRVWENAGVPSLVPLFADARVITSGIESSREGNDPLIHNPRDPWHRPMNYPRVWIAAKFLGFGQQQTEAIGFFIAAVFFGTTFLVVGRINIVEGVLYGVLLCSPAVMLGIERGNIDLLLFAIIATAAALSPSLWAVLIIFLAAVLKLYPICALAPLLRANTRSVIVALTAFAAYVVASRYDLFAIIEATPAARFPAYGGELLFLTLQGYGFGGDPRVHSLLLAAVVLVGALLLALRLPAPEFKPRASQNMLIGLAIYAGTFALLSNFSYRLVFLVLAVPQLCDWSRSKSGYRYFGLTNLALIAVVFYVSAIQREPALLVKDLATWMLLGSASFTLIHATLFRHQVVHSHDDKWRAERHEVTRFSQPAKAEAG